MIRGKDWFTVIKQNAESGEAEFDLRQLQPGDSLRVVTQHTRYDFVILSGRDAELTTERVDRPKGEVRIMGCTFGQSTTIKPDHLFCGGNLEFTFAGGAMTHLTTAIKEVLCLRCLTGWHATCQ